MRKRVLLVVILFVLLGLGLAGCKKGSDEGKQEGDRGASEVGKEVREAQDGSQQQARVLECKSVEEYKAMVKDISSVTEDEYISLVESLGCCEIGENLELSADCPAQKAYLELKKDKAKFPPVSDKIFNSFMKSAYSQVRGMGYSSLNGLRGVSKEKLDFVKEAMVKEKDLHGIYKLLKAVSNEGAVPEVGAYLLEKSKHENAVIRRVAAQGLGSEWSKNVNGAVDRLIELFSDADLEVAKAACSEAGDLGDDKIVDAIVKILNDAAAHELHSSCMKSLSTLWWDYPFHEKYSEAAYKASLDYLRKKPRSEYVPAWNSIGSFSTVNKNKIEAWKKEAQYYNPDEIITVMSDIVMDADAYWMARTAAVKVVAFVGGKVAMDKIGPEITKLNDKDAKHIQDEYENQLKALK